MLQYYKYLLKGAVMHKNQKRREFLKKVLYKAPVVLALGTLVAPPSSNATDIGKPAPKGEASNPPPNGGFGH